MVHNTAKSYEKAQSNQNLIKQPKANTQGLKRGGASLNKLERGA